MTPEERLYAAVLDECRTTRARVEKLCEDVADLKARMEGVGLMRMDVERMKAAQYRVASIGAVLGFTGGSLVDFFVRHLVK